MRIAYLAAGAGGMYCGSCLHDNTLAKALIRLGHEVALLPTYTPLRTDEESVAGERVFYGAVNVYLEQKGAIFRHTPRFLARLLDRPSLLRWITHRFSGSTDAHELGALTLSVLQGEHGAQARELDELVEWLAGEFRPDAVVITNSLLLGLVRRIRERLGVPVVVHLQGEDIFLDQLPNRDEVVAELRRRAADADAFIAPCRYYAEHMGELLALPAGKIAVVPLGIDLTGHRPPAPGDPAATRGADGPVIGYLARICPEKGLHLLAEAFRILARRPGGERLRLRVAGWLGPRDRPYFEEVRQRIERWGLGGQFDYLGEVTFAEKAAFLDSIDVLSVPTTYREPKGLFVLEALAHGVPVVEPRHGAFPELLEATGGGLLVEPGSSEELAQGLGELLEDPDLRRRLRERGRREVERRFDDETMARGVLAVLEEAARPLTA